MTIRLLHLRRTLFALAIWFSVLGSISAGAYIDLSPATAEATTTVALASAPTVENNSKVETFNVSYLEQGKLLALVPVNMSVLVQVDALGNVHVKYPWYSKLTVDNEGEITAKINVAVDEIFREHSLGSVKAAGIAESATFTPEEKQEIKDKVQEVLKETAPGT